MSPSILILILTLLLLLTTTQARQLAQKVSKRELEERATYNGGWALGIPGTSCPADAPVACAPNSGSVNPSCCPSGQTCFGSIDPHCCPGSTSTDCINVVTNFPVCANSTWDMYILTDAWYFCCEPGQFGVLPLHGYSGICEPPDQVVASSLIATSTVQADQAGAGVAAPTSTVVVVSTLKGGGVTTITSIASATGASPTSTSTSGSGSGTGSGNGAVSSATASLKKTLKISAGAIGGIAIGGLVIIAAVLGCLWYCCFRNRGAKRGAVDPYSREVERGPAVEGGNAAGEKIAYTPVPNPGLGGETEYKGASSAVSPVGGWAQTPPPPQNGAYGPPPPQNGAYPPPQQPYGPPPAEAPGRWETRAEMGAGRAWNE